MTRPVWGKAIGWALGVQATTRDRMAWKSLRRLGIGKMSERRERVAGPARTAGMRARALGSIPAGSPASARRRAQAAAANPAPRMVVIFLMVCGWGGRVWGAPTYYRDVAPILEARCVGCHRAGEVGPMALTTYAEVRPWAKAIRDQVVGRTMPPWFAEAGAGKFSNDRRLTGGEVAAVSEWVAAGAPAGDRVAGVVREKKEGWSIGAPDAVFSMPAAVAVPASGELDYQYAIVPTEFAVDTWVTAAELRPGDRAVVHHAVVYVREPGSAWLRGMRAPGADAVTKSDILFTYTPGNSADEWPEGTAKLIPAGSDLVFQMHYTARGRAASDRSRIGLRLAHEKPRERVLTLQMGNDRLYLPPGRADYRVKVSGTLPNEARLLSLYPHMHLRGKEFEYALYGEDGEREVLLRVRNYDFYWQLNYKLAEARRLKAGTRLECAAVFDNSRNNRRNPDPEAFVRFGPQSTDEMMIGFFDVAVPADVDKARFFQRK